MTNFQVYKKTLAYSFLMFAVSLVALAVAAGCTAGGFFLFANESNSAGLIGLVVGFVVGLILLAVINIFITNRIKAAQIAMMTKGVVEGVLPEATFKAGFEEVKGRFGTITVFFIITNAIKGIFNQLGHLLTKFGNAVGGDVGGGIASAIDTAIQILIGFLCDCCLGWILYRKEVNAVQAGCEGAVIFFKHGKTLIRNIGRIFGMGFLSLVLVGGAFFGAFYGIFMQFPTMFADLSAEITKVIVENEGEVSEFITNPAYFTLLMAGIAALFVWSSFHGVLVRPFILVGVLRNFMAAGKEHMPTEADIVELEAKSPKLAKLRKKNI